MNVSTNLPYGCKAVRDYLAIRGETRLPMNVSKAADIAFIRELKRTDSRRYERLVKNIENMQVAVYAKTKSSARYCAQCNLALPSDIRADALYCDTTCQRASRQSRMAA